MLLDGYNKEDFFDEMFTDENSVRPHYQRAMERFQRLDTVEFKRKQTAVDLAFMRGGVTFTVYNDNQGTERIFPFDLMPRIIPANEWDVIEKGLVQRLTALNMFLHDIYHEQKILKERVIPPHYILGAKHSYWHSSGYRCSGCTPCRWCHRLSARLRRPGKPVRTGHFRSARTSSADERL